jgi:hypothetical protein
MAEGMLEAYDYVSAMSRVEAFCHIEESECHMGAGKPAFTLGMRVLLPGSRQAELRRRHSRRPILPWETGSGKEK